MSKAPRIIAGSLCLVAAAALAYYGLKEAEPIAVAVADLCNKEHDKELVVAEGTVELPDSFSTNDNYGELMFKESTGDCYCGIRVFYYVEKKNTMERLENGYTEEDVKIYDNEGNPIHLGDKIKVTGTVYNSYEPYIIKGEKIEKIK